MRKAKEIIKQTVSGKTHPKTKEKPRIKRIDAKPVNNTRLRRISGKR